MVDIHAQACGAALRGGAGLVIDDGAGLVADGHAIGTHVARSRPGDGKVVLDAGDALAGAGSALKGDLRLAHLRGRRLGGRFGGRGVGGIERGVAVIVFQVTLRAAVEHAVGGNGLVAQIGVDLPLEVDDGLRGRRAVDAVGLVQIAQRHQHFLHIADGRGVGIRADDYHVVLVAGAGVFRGGRLGNGRFGNRRLGGRGRSGRGGNRVVDIVFKVTQRILVAVSGDGEDVVAQLLVNPDLEVAHGDGGGGAIHAVNAIEEAQIAQHGLHIADALSRGVGADAAFGRRGCRRGCGGRNRGRRGGCGRGRGGRRGRGLHVLPPVGDDDHIVIGGGVHLAGHFQHLVAIIAVDKGLEFPDRAARGRAVNAVGGTGGKLSQRDEQLLHAAHLAGGRILVDDGAAVRRLGDNRRQRGRALGGPGRDGSLIQPVKRDRTGNAVHGEFGVDGVGAVHIGLEIAHGLAGGAVIHAGGLRGVQPAQGDQLPLQAGDFLGRGIAVYNLAGRPRRSVGRRRGRAHAAGLVVVFLVGVAAVDIIHPRQFRIGNGGIGGLHMRRGRGRLLRFPERVRGQRGVGHHVLRGVENAGKQADQQKRYHQHAHGRAADDQRPLARGTALALFLGLRRRAGGRFALGDIGRAVFFKVKVALFGVFNGFDAGLEALHAALEGLLFAGYGHDRTVV